MEYPELGRIASSGTSGSLLAMTESQPKLKGYNVYRLLKHQHKFLECQQSGEGQSDCDPDRCA